MSVGAGTEDLRRLIRAEVAVATVGTTGRLRRMGSPDRMPIDDLVNPPEPETAANDSVFGKFVGKLKGLVGSKAKVSGGSLDLGKLQHLRQKAQELRRSAMAAKDEYLRARDSKDQTAMSRAKGRYDHYAKGVRSYEDRISKMRGSMTFKEWRDVLSYVDLLLAEGIHGEV